MSSRKFDAGETVGPPIAVESGSWVWGLRSLAVLALGLTTYLAWAALTASPVAGCGGNDVFDCEHVLSSKWSKIGGLPVGVPAVVLYSCVLSALVFCRHPSVPRIRQLSWMFVTTGGIAAGLSAVWFTGLQIFALGQLCPWCVGAHSCGFAICGLLLWKHPLGSKQTGQLAAVGTLGVAVLITLQILTPAPPTFEVLRYEEHTTSVAEDFVVSPGSDVTEDEFSDDFFAAPGQDTFEAPTGATTIDSMTDAEQDDNSSGGDSTGTAAASLLLLLPPQISMMVNVVAVPVQSSDESSTEGNDESSDSEESAAHDDAKPKRRLIGVNGNKFRLDIRQWPLLGQPDAKYVFVEMFDYTCAHCRNTHRAIRGAFDRYGDDLAIIALPVPLDRQCNRYASSSGGTHRDSCEISRIAVAVWCIDPEKFHQLHDWLFVTSRTALSTKQEAEQLVGQERLTKELKYPTAGEYIAKHVQLYNRVGAGSVPKLMFPRSSMVGEVSSTQTLCNTIERELVSR